MVQCVLGVSLYSSEAVGKCFSEPRTWGLKRKLHFAKWTWYTCNRQHDGRAHGGIFPSFCTSGVIKYLHFLREIYCLPFLDGKSFDSTVFADKGKNRYRSPHSRIALCVLGMHLHSFETAGRYLLWIWNWRMTSKSSHFPLWNLCSCNIQPARRTQQAHSTLECQNSFG